MITKFIFAMLLIVAVSGIIVAQQTAGADASNRSTARKQGQEIDLQSGTQLAAQLQGTLDARHAKVGDRVVLKTTEAVRQDGHVIIPKGAQMLGRVTDVQQQTKDTGESHISLLFDQIRSGSSETPITASILSITRSNAIQGNNSAIDSDLMNQSSASAHSSAPPRNGAGLLGGAGNAVAGVVNNTTSTVGNVAETATSAVGSTVGATTNTAGNLTGSLRGLQISQSTGASAQGGSTLSLTGGNLRLESGTTFNLAVSSSANAGTP
jgi:hypothetical protein